MQAQIMNNSFQSVFMEENNFEEINEATTITSFKVKVEFSDAAIIIKEILENHRDLMVYETRYNGNAVNTLQTKFIAAL